MMKCILHPRYVGKGKPTSRRQGCTCMQVWIEAAQQPPRRRHKDEPVVDPKAQGKVRTQGTGPQVLEPASALIEAVMARKDPALHQVKAPAGYALRGASTMNRFNEDGTTTPVLQWVKTKDTLDPEMLAEIARGAVLKKPIPAAPVVKAPKHTADDLETIVAIGDPHFGMLAWDKETGDDWDVEIARSIHTKAIRKALELSPPSSKLVVINLGDGLHADGNNATTTAGTRVDVDSRWPKVVGIFVETMNLAITEGLQKHKHVELVNIRGNHDDLSSLVVRMILAERWRDNPRVTIADNLKMVWGHRFGSNLICALHGDKTKLNNIPALIAEDFRKEWGESVRTHVYAGHYHSHQVKEFPGVEVEYMRVLASKDAWHAGQGYRSQRSLRCDIWSRQHGRIMTHEIGVDSLK